MIFAALTPIPIQWSYSLMEITRGIRVVEKPTFDETDWRFWNLRRTEEQNLHGRSHWLCIEREGDWNDNRLLLELADDLRTAILGFQLWMPMGWDGFIVACSQNGQGSLNVHRVHLPEGYAKPLWGRVLDIRKCNPADLPELVEGTLNAVESNCVPIVNPFRFLEIGLQTAIHHRRAGAVLWVMGLDGLLAAEREERFSTRLKKLLGSDTRMFPEDWAGRRPTYTVGELATDMFEFRSLIAHGKEIIAKYREPITFEF